jgi:hypothetical protein
MNDVQSTIIATVENADECEVSERGVAAWGTAEFL